MRTDEHMVVGSYSHIQMSGGFLQPREEIEQYRSIIPGFDYESWRNHVDEDLERRVVPRTGITLRDITGLVTSNRYRGGPRRFFTANREYYKDGIRDSIRANRPVDFVLPSFPVKCFNPLKVRRRTPDLAEVGCLSQLYSLCKDVQRLYDPGARVVLVTDGLVYAPIFREPIAHALKYREEVGRLIKELGFEDYISLIDMGDLVANRRDEFDRTHNTVERQVARYWREHPSDPDRIRLIENTTTNINLMMYPEASLLDFFVNHNTGVLGKEIRGRAVESAFEYLVFNQTIREIDLLARAFPQSLRATCHPKEGQLGLHLVHQKSFNFPWNGVGVLRENGTVRVEFEYEARRNPRYVAVHIEA